MRSPIPEEFRYFEECGCDPFEILPAVLAILGTAVGASVEVELPGSAGLVVPVLHAAFLKPESQEACSLIQWLMDELRRAFEPASSIPIQNDINEVQSEEFSSFQPVADPLTQAQFAFGDRNFSSLIVLQSPTASQIRTLLKNTDSPTLVHYSALGFERVMAKGTSRWVRDSRLLIDSKFSSLSMCGPESLARLLSVDNPWGRELILAQLSKAPAGAIGVADFLKLRSVLARLLQRVASEPVRTLSLEAHAKKLMSREPNPAVVRLAAQIGALSYCCLLETGSELTGEVVAAGLSVARALLSRSGQLKELVIRDHNEAMVRRSAGQMLKLVKRAGSIPQRNLLRRCRRQSLRENAEPLARLLASSRVSRSKHGRSVILTYNER